MSLKSRSPNLESGGRKHAGRAAADATLQSETKDRNSLFISTEVTSWFPSVNISPTASYATFRPVVERNGTLTASQLCPSHASDVIRDPVAWARLLHRQQGCNAQECMREITISYCPEHLYYPLVASWQAKITICLSFLVLFNCYDTFFVTTISLYNGSLYACSMRPLLPSFVVCSCST